MQKRTILLLSEGFGTGHTQAAQALSENLMQAHPDIQTKVLELGTCLHPTLARWVFSAFRKIISSQPKWYGILYRSLYKKSLSGLTQLALHRIFYAQTNKIIQEMNPDAIICTHPFPSAVVSRLKQSGLETPLCTVITDYDAHGTWISAGVNKYLVSSQNVKDKLVVRGVPEHNIEITGIPIRPAFLSQSGNKNEIRRRFGLEEKPTVLIMGGGWGIIVNETLLNRLLSWKDRIQLIFVLGSNHKALAKMKKDTRFNHANIHLLGYTEEVDKLMEVSDLLLTKPGGLTCTEGLAKGMPMLFYEPIPGQEEENMRYFAEQGLGEIIRSEATIDYWFRLLSENSEWIRQTRISGMKPLKQSPLQWLEIVLKLLGDPVKSSPAI